MKLSLPISSFGGDKWIDYFYALDTTTSTPMKCDPANDGIAGNCGPGSLYESYDYRFNSSIADPRSRTTSAEPAHTIDAQHPYKTDEFTLGLDHELTPTISLGVGYVRKRADYAIEDVGVLPALLAHGIQADRGVFHRQPGLRRHAGAAARLPGLQTPKPAARLRQLGVPRRKRLAQNWSLNASYTGAVCTATTRASPVPTRAGAPTERQPLFRRAYMSWTSVPAPRRAPERRAALHRSPARRQGSGDVRLQLRKRPWD